MWVDSLRTGLLWITHVPGPFNYAWDRRTWVYVQHDREIVDRFASGPTFERVEAACVDYLRAQSGRVAQLSGSRA